MNKIYQYSLGVFCWLSAACCQAAEMFEVLPDLPDPLAYAVQPASASTVSGNASAKVLAEQSVGHEPSLISVLLSLLFVVLLIYVTGILFAKLNKVGFKTLKQQQGEFAKSQVSVISTTQLGANKTLHVVELDGKRMLIGASASAIQLIKDLGSSSSDTLTEEYSRIEIPNIKIPKIEIPKIEIPSIGFSKMVTKTHKPLEEVEKPADAEKQEEVPVQEEKAEPVIEEVSSEGIIDSLFAEQKESIEEEEDAGKTASEHIVDPDDFALYKKYLG